MLDTYQDERHTAGKSSLRLPNSLLRLTLFGRPVLTRQAATAAAAPASEASCVADQVAEAVSGINVGYSGMRWTSARRHEALRQALTRWCGAAALAVELFDINGSC